MDYDLEIEKIEGRTKDNYRKVIAMLNIFKRELANFDYNGNYENLSHFLKKINAYLPKLSRNKKKIVVREITNLHETIHSLITSRPNCVDKFNLNFIELKKIIDNLEGMDISYRYNCIDKYDGNAYNLIRYLLFEDKNLFFVQYAMEKYPHFINASKEDNECIILDVVDKYLEAIDKYTKDGVLRFNDDLFYYDQVLECLLSKEKIFYSKELQFQALKKVEAFLLGSDKNKYNGEVKAKLVFWTNELLDKLEKQKREESLSHLSYKTEVTIYFHESVLSEARRFSPNNLKKEFQNRTKIDDEYIITIDGDKTEEIDDGLSARKLKNGNYLLGVHITDPTGYVEKNNILYDEANLRTTSIYSSLGISPMFPDEYAKNYMSLTKNKNRFATSYYLEITPQGEILLDRCVFKKTVVKVNQKMTYNSFNLLVKNGCSDKKMRETIDTLQEICNCLDKRFTIDNNYRIANRYDSNVSRTNVVGSSSSEKIVEYTMLAVNSTIANYAAKRGFPFIYRAHEIDQEYLKKIDYFDKKLKDNPTSENYDVFVRMLKNTYPASFYTTDSSKGHTGIGLPHYSHITSPLRRFADVLATEALNLMYFNNYYTDKEISELEDRLKEGARYINERKTAIDYFTSRCGKVKRISF